MKRKTYLTLACLLLAGLFTGCASYQLADGTYVTTLGGTRAFSSLHYENKTYGITTDMSGYQVDQSKDYQMTIGELQEAMKLFKMMATPVDAPSEIQ